ncbi:MAG: transposase [Anaerolineae bacterium]|jgi:putative transposase|nr:transposase [Anaerolineae bacterium]
MTYDPDRHHRRSIRLQGYDYSQAGAYFVTVCTHDRKCLLGKIVDQQVCLTGAGEIVSETWHTISSRFACVELDAFVIMPNHIHGILVILDGPGPVGAELALPNHQAKRPPDMIRRDVERCAPTLGHIIQAFKSISAIACNRHLDRAGLPFWQRNYYEHVIRDADDLNQIRQYIENNPTRWAEDQENPIHHN